mgnify:FL=1
MKTAKPRCSAEWRQRFQHWQRPASDTEEQKIESARGQIQKALDKSSWLQAHPHRVIKQGSYENNTNVRNETDVDLCVCTKHALFFEAGTGETLTREELGLSPLDFTFKDYKQHVVDVLAGHFGIFAVQAGNKAIQLHAHDENKIDADVLPAFRFDLFEPRSRWPNGVPTLRAQGVGFYTEGGTFVFNFPEQHIANGRSKNERTSRRYKRAVRILKRLRTYMKDNAALFDEMPSFLIESLVYNCPDSDFGDADLVEVIRRVLLSLKSGLADQDQVCRCTEVNGIKLLFRTNQGWTLDQARSFVNNAYDYVGFGG